MNKLILLIIFLLQLNANEVSCKKSNHRDLEQKIEHLYSKVVSFDNSLSYLSDKTNNYSTELEKDNSSFADVQSFNQLSQQIAFTHLEVGTLIETRDEINQRLKDILKSCKSQSNRIGIEFIRYDIKRFKVVSYTLSVAIKRFKPILDTYDKSKNKFTINNKQKKMITMFKTTQTKVMYEKCLAGNMDSCNDLAVKFENGNDVERNQKIANELFLKACTHNNAIGCNNIGINTLRSKTKSRLENAAKYFKKGCDLGYMPSCYKLALMWELELNNSVNAAHYYKKACSNKHIKSCTKIGTFYYLGKGVFMDKGLAKKPLTEACQLDDYEACYTLGIIFTEKEFFNKNKAIRMYKKACNGGYASACLNLGAAYYRGKIVQKDKTKGIRLFKKGCNLGSSTSCSNYQKTKKYLKK